MIVKTKLGVIVKTNKFKNDNEKAVTVGTDHDNWGFTYSVNDPDMDRGGPAPEAGTSKEDYDEGTIFLDSSIDEFYGNTTVQNIVINNKGPVFIADKTQYTAVSKPWKIEFDIKSEDYIDIGHLTIETNGLELFKADRKHNYVSQGTVLKDITLKKYGNIYTLSFTLNPVAEDVLSFFGVTHADDIEDILNNNQIQITVFDLPGNGIQIKTDGKWNYIGDIDDVNNLKPLVLEYYDIVPSNRILTTNIEGSTWVKCYNPNASWWSIRPKIQLEDDSIGYINTASWDWTKYEKNGVVTFQIINIRKKGLVKTEAWIQVENSEIAAAVRNATYAEAILEFKYMDPEGRKIKLMTYVPKYLNDEMYYHFTKMTEDFLNTMYESLSNGKNISILEKAARIDNFNVIDQIERPLIQHYADEFGIEIKPNIDDCQQFLMQKRVGKQYAYADFTDDDIYDFMRYVYREIPIYNQYKGSYQGIKMALNILGLSVKLIELWAKTDDSQIDDMLRQDEINDDPFNLTEGDSAMIAQYYLTSRFDIDMQEDDWSFTDFNNMSSNIIRLISQCKPVTRTIRKLSKIWYDVFKVKTSYALLPFENKQPFTHFNYTYDLLNNNALMKHEFSENDKNITNVSKLFIPYKANKAKAYYAATVDYEKEDDKGKQVVVGYDYNDSPTYTLCNTSLQTYNVLYGIEHKIEISRLKKLKFTLKHTYTEMIGVQQFRATQETPSPDEYLYPLTDIVKGEDTPMKNNYPGSDDGSIEVALFDELNNIVDNCVKVYSDSTGYWLEFYGLAAQKLNYLIAGTFNKMYGYGEPICYVDSSRTSDTMSGVTFWYFNRTYTYRKDNKLEFNICFDIPLGTNYITQGLAKWSSPTSAPTLNHEFNQILLESSS